MVYSSPLFNAANKDEQFSLISYPLCVRYSIKMQFHSTLQQPHELGANILFFFLREA